MIRKPLITINDIQQFRPTASISQQRIEPFILEAQQNDLRPIMNEALYTDFITKYDVSTDPMYANYQTLLNGGTYLYAGRTIEYPGLKPIIVYYALARFIMSAPISIASFGVVTKKAEQSDNVDLEVLKEQAQMLRSNAILYGEEFKKFAYINIATYPLYGYKYSAQQVDQSGVGFF